MLTERDLIAERYRLLRPIGTGGMGRVWLARDEVLHRTVAIKELLLPDWLSRPDRAAMCERALREARAAARFNHPNVVRVYDVAQAGDRPWIVMEYVPSQSLYDLVQEAGPVPPQRAAEIGLSILAGLNAAHSAGVLHRDVKPGNVLIAHDGRVVLTDFGLATFKDSGGGVTRSGLVMGSPQYLSPERARDGVSTAEADLWSLGATLYAAVEGRSPYARSDAIATLTALATEAPDPPKNAGALQPVLDGLLRKDPRNRMSGTEAERLLRRVAAGERIRRLPRPSRRSLVIAASAILLIVIAALARSVGPVWDQAAGRSGGGQTASTPAEHRPGDPWGPADPGYGRPPDGGPGHPGPQPAAPPGAQEPSCLDRGSGPAPQQPPLASPTTGVDALPAGWSWYHDQTGYWLPVPADWGYRQDGGVLCFVEPGGPGLITMTTPPAQHDPFGALSHQRDRLRQEQLSYHEIKLGGVEYFDLAVDWEYTYRSPGGELLHVVRRSFKAPHGRAYELTWVAPDAKWTAQAKASWQVIVAGFHPAS